MFMPMHYDRARARSISFQVRVALDEAIALLDVEARRSEVDNLLRHARELLNLLNEQFALAPPEDHVALHINFRDLAEAVDWVSALLALKPSEMFWPSSD